VSGGNISPALEDITEALWGTRVTPNTVSNLNKTIYVKIDVWRNRGIEGEHPYVYLDDEAQLGRRGPQCPIVGQRR
jgi:transposase-like protein